MATSGMTVTSTRTASILDPENFSQEHLKRQREQIIRKWSELGFLEGLQDHVQENITLLYEGQASALLNETEPHTEGSWDSIQFPIVRNVVSRWEKSEKERKEKLLIKSLKKHKL